MTDHNDRDLTAQAQAEQQAITGWVVQAYKTLYQTGLAILRGFGLPADEAARAFVTGAVTFVEDIVHAPGMPTHMIEQTFTDVEKALRDGLTAVQQIRATWAADVAAAAADPGEAPAADVPRGPRAVPDPETTH